jgi:hypothetical protein
VFFSRLISTAERGLQYTVANLLVLHTMDLWLGLVVMAYIPYSRNWWSYRYVAEDRHWHEQQGLFLSFEANCYLSEKITLLVNKNCLFIV